MDPGLAPGYIYSPNPPPDDNEYTITNNMSAWSWSFPAWLSIGDNDPDPNGYMMVVNASFSPGVFYEKIIDDLCDNSLYEFSVDVINLIRPGTPSHIFPDVSFFIDDELSFTTGNVPQDGRWHTFGFVFMTTPGQTSVKLTLKNNAPGGIGNDLALDNLSFRACGPEANITSSLSGTYCENGMFPLLTAAINSSTGVQQWQMSSDQGMTWMDLPGATMRTYQVQPLPVGAYQFRYLYASSSANLSNPNCYITSDIFSLLVEVPQETWITDTICEGLMISFGDTLYSTSGIYQEVFTNANGCDSMVTLDLTVVPDPHVVADFQTEPTSCMGAVDGALYVSSISGISPPFIFKVNEHIISPPDSILMVAAGTYTVRIENAYGCYDEDVVTVSDGPPLILITSPDTMVRLGHSVLLTAQPNLPFTTISWAPSTFVDCPSCPETHVMPYEDLVFEATGISEGGCSDTGYIMVRVDRTPVLYIPNVFSPNGDQINDGFTASMDPLNVIAIEEVVILDRWGGVLAQKSNISSAQQVHLWDGDTPGGPVGPGTYIYLVRYRLADGTIHSTAGDLTLVK